MLWGVGKPGILCARSDQDRCGAPILIFSHAMRKRCRRSWTWLRSGALYLPQPRDRYISIAWRLAGIFAKGHSIALREASVARNISVTGNVRMRDLMSHRGEGKSGSLENAICEERNS